MKLQLPMVTLVCVDCRPPEAAIRTLEHCKGLVDFGAVKLFTHRDISYPHVTIEEIKCDPPKVIDGLVHYSRWVLTRLHEFIDTTHLLIVQHDAWILHPEKWNPDWLRYDYIGPLFAIEGKVSMGGFSLRTKKLMALTAELHPAEESVEAYVKKSHLYEDGVISYTLRSKLEARGCKFPEESVAAQFGFGGNKNHYCSEPFGFHGLYALDTLLGGTGYPTHRWPDGSVHDDQEPPRR
jgi:hypothetical protein